MTGAGRQLSVTSPSIAAATPSGWFDVAPEVHVHSPELNARMACSRRADGAGDMRQFSRKALRRLGRSEGTNLVEAAIVLPVLLLLTFAAMDFAILMFAHLALQNGVSQATRYAVTGNVMPGSTREASIIAAMRQSTPTLTLATSDFTFSHLPIGGNTWVGGTGTPGTIEKVTVNYTWHIMSPLIRPFFTNGEVHLSAESSMKNEPLFQ